MPATGWSGATTGSPAAPPAAATSGGWDWILYECLWRYRPSLAEELLIRILHATLRLGLYARRMQSPPLRHRYLRWPTG